MKISRSTWIMLLIFVVALGVTWLFEWSPIKNARKTPTPTSQPNLLSGWSIGDLVEINLVKETGGAVSLRRNPDNTWSFADLEGKAVDQGKIMQLLTSLVALKQMGTLEISLEPAELGLTNPGQTITLVLVNNEKIVIKIGFPTPINTGYYVQVNQASPIIVANSSIENMLSEFSKDFLVMATPTSIEPLLPTSTNLPPPVDTDIPPTSTVLPSGTPTVIPSTATSTIIPATIQPTP